jgi:hypothetical protein
MSATSTAPHSDPIAGSGGVLLREATGSIKLTTSATASETSDDTLSFTAGFAKARAKDWTPTEAEALTTLDDMTRRVYLGAINERNHAHEQHPTGALFGQRPARIGPSRWGYYIGNAKYRHAGSLGEPVNDAQRMRKTMEAAGLWTVAIERDRTAAEMRTGFSAALAATPPGGEILLYYAGHGSVDGMMGVDFEFTENPLGLLRYSAFSDDLEAAAARGVHVLAVLDTCHSGALGSLLVRRAAIERGRRADAGSPAVARAKYLFLLAGEIARRVDDAVPTYDRYGERTNPSEMDWDTATETSPQRMPRREAVQRAIWKDEVYPLIQSLVIDLALAGIDAPIPNTPSYDFESLALYGDLALELADRWRAVPPLSVAALPDPSPDVHLVTPSDAARESVDPELAATDARSGPVSR